MALLTLMPGALHPTTMTFFAMAMVGVVMVTVSGYRGADAMPHGQPERRTPTRRTPTRRQMTLYYGGLLGGLLNIGAFMLSAVRPPVY